MQGVEINNKVMMSVIDTGTGIPQDCQEKIFEKFGQVKSSMKSRPKGTGLGLPICKEIIERHGGTIWVMFSFVPILE
ncbi:MAG: ATP-binding protein [Candidatus Scalinduaceae bacterium]